MISFVQFWITVVACITFIIYHRYSCLSGFLLCSCMKRKINFYCYIWFYQDDSWLEVNSKCNANLKRTKDRCSRRIINDELPTPDWLRHNYIFRFIWFVKYCRLLVVLWPIYQISYQMGNRLRWSWIVSDNVTCDIDDLCQLYGNTLCSSTQSEWNAKEFIKLCSFWRWEWNSEGSRMIMIRIMMSADIFTALSKYWVFNTKSNCTVENKKTIVTELKRKRGVVSLSRREPVLCWHVWRIDQSPMRDVTTDYQSKS